MLDVTVNIEKEISDEMIPRNQFLFHHIVFTDEDVNPLVSLPLVTLMFQNCLIPESFFKGISDVIINLKHLFLEDNYDLKIADVFSMLMTNERLEYLTIFVPPRAQSAFSEYMSYTTTLTKLMLNHVERNPDVFLALVNQKTINNFVITNTRVGKTVSDGLTVLLRENKNITRYAFTSCIFDDISSNFLLELSKDHSLDTPLNI